MGYINDFLSICNYYVNNAIIYKWSLTNIKIMIIKKIFQENYILFFIITWDIHHKVNATNAYSKPNASLLKSIN